MNGRDELKIEFLGMWILNFSFVVQKLLQNSLAVLGFLWESACLPKT
jgi:hypothetical protein